MLKIKDNVDLKELVYHLKDKYNLKVEEDKDYYFLITNENNYYLPKKDGRKGKLLDEEKWQFWRREVDYGSSLIPKGLIRLLSATKTKYDELVPEWTSWSYTDFDILYDLIKADLVEKVGDN